MTNGTNNMSKDILCYQDMFLLYKKYMFNRIPIKVKYEFLYNKIHYNTGVIITVVGRPGHGKTMLLDCITDDIEYNIGYKKDAINIIDFQLEMPAQEIVKRRLLKAGIDIKDENAIKEYYKMTKERNNYYLFVSNIPSIDSIYSITRDFMIKNGYDNKINIIKFDHALMLRDRRNSIPMLMQTAIRLKQEFNAIVIVLSQLNRAVSDIKRAKEGQDYSKIKETDIYDTDALMQYSDILISVDRPFKRGISHFTSKNIPTKPNTTHISVLKNRVTDVNDEYLYDAINNDFILIENITPYEFNNSDKHANSNGQDNITQSSQEEYITSEQDDLTQEDDELEF